jgi:predicted nucleic acid-binding protein
MSDKHFIDTNILVYCYSNDEPEKRDIAQDIVQYSNTIISTQVLTELSNTMKKSFNLSWNEIGLLINETVSNFKIHINLPDTINKALEIANKYGFSFYDSLIISSAIEENCTILFTEDMHNGTVIDQTLLIVNPFKNK